MKNLLSIIFLSLFLGGLTFLLSCKDDDEPAPVLSTETDFLTFSFVEQIRIDGDGTNHTIDVEVLNGTDLTALTPTFTLSAGATSSPATGTSGDYSSPVTITVTAEDGITVQDWVVTVTEAAVSTETDILTFSFTEQIDPADIDATNHRVDVDVVNGTDLTSLIPTYTVSPGATVVGPASGVAGDFSVERTIILTAQDGTTTQEWKVLVTETAPGGSTHTDILSFSFPEQIGDAVIDATNHTVDVEVVIGTALTALTPTFTLSSGATSSPVSGTSGNYSSAVTIAVTAEDGITTQDWTVNVTVAGGATVVFGDGGTKATAITNLVVDGVTYDVEFVDDFPRQVYGPFSGTYTFTTQSAAETAMNEMNIALQDAGATITGPQGGDEDPKYRIGFEGQVVGGEFCNFSISRYDGTSWVLEGNDSAAYNVFFPTIIFAVFTQK